jgi:hypothetical protein
VGQLVDILTTIGELLPQFETYPKLFPNTPRLKRALVAIYSDIVAFCARANTFYSTTQVSGKIAAETGGFRRRFKRQSALP